MRCAKRPVAELLVHAGAPKSKALTKQSDGSYLGPEHYYQLPLQDGVVRSKKGSVVVSKQQGVATMFDLINQPKWDDRPCMGTLTGRGDVEQPGQLGHWEYKTYGQIKLMSKQFASGLKSLNVFNAKERLGIWLPNSPEWMVVDIACCMYVAWLMCVGARCRTRAIAVTLCGRYSVVSVSLYDTLGESQGSYIVSDAGCEVCYR